MEQIRIKADYGTISGYTGLWLVQHRFTDAEEWATCYIAKSKAEANAYVSNTPDWARG